MALDIIPEYKDLIEQARSALEPVLAKHPELAAFVVVPCWSGDPAVLQPTKTGFIVRTKDAKMDPAAFIHAAAQTNMMVTLLLQSIEQHLVAAKRKQNESTKEASRSSG